MIRFLCEIIQECPVFEPLNQFADRVCNERIDEKRKRDAAGELIYRGVQVWPTAGILSVLAVSLRFFNSTYRISTDRSTRRWMSGALSK